MARKGTSMSKNDKISDQKTKVNVKKLTTSSTLQKNTSERTYEVKLTKSQRKNAEKPQIYFQNRPTLAK